MKEESELLKFGDCKYFFVRGNLKVIKSERSAVYYDACSKPDCMKKVFEREAGEYYCESCKESIREPLGRFIT